jgi:ubiquinone/menaquinone biosynthesis C-methylase UbiE
MQEDRKGQVRRRYAEAALAVTETGKGSETSCCEPSCCSSSSPEAQKVDLTGGSYSAEEREELPQEALSASLGCGNPTALATLSPGEVVLDLGSGGGIDVLLSARRVSPGGKAYGVDMTDEMLALARKNQRKAGLENVEFLKGEIEDVPLPDDHVDVVISNCVINLSPNKPRVLSETFRVLKPGGRFAVSDVVFLGSKRDLPESVLRKTEAWTGCISGAMEKGEYEEILRESGFEEVSVEVTNVYDPETVEQLSGPEEVEALRRVPAASAFVRAKKPVA